ncbi:cytochrome d ubiquinol oxidase subunit II [Streptomyces sp. IBSNAI002]|uniref:cytochrome d ubiquinol oxidase subunit II n=1 Tax=Streptomyces sp. IBSNAI002 TaxID=3457500 RepID=UPI003FD3AB0E
MGEPESEAVGEACRANCAGCQPWAVYGLLKTRDADSPGVSTTSAVISLSVFTLLYAVTAVVTGAFLFWTRVHRGGPVCGLVVLSVAVVALLATVEQTALGRDGVAFALSGPAVVATVATLFLALFPDVMPSTADPAWSPTVAGSAASPYTLEILTWVASFMTPVVLVYQAWTYRVFRKRVGSP